MDRIAFIIGDIFLYWNSVVMVLAAAAAICLFLVCYLSAEGKGTAAAVAVPMAMVLSLVLGRLAHWYFRPDSYSGFGAAMTNYTSGGYALLGAFAGCALTALVLKWTHLEPDVLLTLDSMSIAGCGGIALGRLACFFSAADRGQLLETIRSLPWAYSVNNVVTGAEEYRLATFVLQAMASAAIFAALVVYALLARKKRGDVTLLFLLLYGMSQAVLDSTRYDSLFMRSNGFISIVQLLGAAAVVLAAVLFSIQMVRSRGFRGWFVAIWLAMLALLGGAGYMEYYVQRHGDLALLSYSVMTLCLSGIVVLALLTCALRRVRTED